MKYPLIVTALLCQQAFVIDKVQAADNVVAKSVWIEAMKTRLPNALCVPDEVFLKCFDVTQDQCIEETVRATKVCLSNFADQMPGEFHQPNDGQTWGRKVGECAGDAYEAKFSDKKKDSKECQALMSK